jgi:hypothetical protein
VCGVFLFDDRQQGIRKAIERRGIDALGIANRVGDESKVRPVDQSHAIEKEKSHGGMMISFGVVVEFFSS